MKYLCTLTLFLTYQLAMAQWDYNPTSMSGIESPTNSALGPYSVAMGNGTTASGFGTLTLGSFNTIDNSASSTFSLTNRALVIGNGTGVGSESDAFTVLFNGNTTIAGSMTATSFIGDGSQLSNLPISGLEALPAGVAHGWRLIGIDPNNYGQLGQAAIDLSISSNPGNRGATGFLSFAVGERTHASGNYSTAIGSFSNATNQYAFSGGKESVSSGRYSFTYGNGARASGYGTVAVGLWNTDDSPSQNEFNASNNAFIIGNGESPFTPSNAITVKFDGTTTVAGPVTAASFIGDGSQLSNLPISGLEALPAGVAHGWRLIGMDPNNYGQLGQAAIDLSISSNPDNRGATGFLSFAVGERTHASGNYSTAIGSFSNATNQSAFSGGKESVSSGRYSFTYGNGARASGYGTVAVGLWNTDDSPSADQYNAANNAFIIGNSESPFTPSNAMTVKFDGTTTIAGDLTVNSDVRLKTDIESLGSTLGLIELLDGKRYSLINSPDQSKIGMLAQDVQKVFPELIHEAGDEMGTLSLNYQGLIPVLINAVNEQQKTIESQQKQIDQLTIMVNQLIEKN